MSLGTPAPRGRPGVLAVCVAGLMRPGPNLFFPMMLRRIAADIP